MNLSLLVGLSVDYVVHMAEAYFHAPNPDRLGKVNFMLEHVGVSILSGALTTIGASIFMLPAKIQFFIQFGTFLLCTIGFSLIYTLTIFTVVLSMIGPEDNVGDIRVPFIALRRRVLGRSETDIDCDQCDGKGFLSNVVKDEEKPKLNINNSHSVIVTNSAFENAENISKQQNAPIVKGSTTTLEVGNEQTDGKILSSNL